MFRLIRLVLFTCAAFIAGVFYERNNARTVCLDGNGTWERGICYGLDAQNG